MFSLERPLVVSGKLSAVRFNIMVVGECGNGKTTMLRALFRRYSDKTIAKKEFTGKRQTIRIEEIGQFTLPAENLDIDVHLYDSPGYGDQINNQSAIDDVRTFLVAAHMHWLQVNGNHLTESERNQQDVRIHLLFYFIAPHRMKQIDKEFLKQLSGLANIVPVVSKSDTMTLHERAEHLMLIHSTIESLDGGSSSTIFDFNEVEDEDHPFLPLVIAVASSPVSSAPNTINNSAAEDDSSNGLSMMSSIFHVEVPLSEQILEVDHEHHYLYSSRNMAPLQLPRVRNIFGIVCDNRKYPWGELDLDNENHSDFRRLQRLVFESGQIVVMREKTQLLSQCLLENGHVDVDEKKGCANTKSPLKADGFFGAVQEIWNKIVTWSARAFVFYLFVYFFTCIAKDALRTAE
jgi:septin family protein